MKVVLSGGGTGGHIYPAISVGQTIRRLQPDADLLFIGSSHGPEGKIAAENAIDFVGIPSSPLSGAISLKTSVALSKLFLGVFRARRILDRYNPDVVIGTGGYTTAAVLLAQKLRHGKLVMHEQNAVPGRTNLWISRLVDVVCVSFADSARYFSRCKVVHTGMPVRTEFADLPDKQSARKQLNLDPDMFTLLVVGGSQGARALNKAALDIWSAIDDGNTQVLHQTGVKNIEEVKSQSATLANSTRYHIEGYVNMPLALASADLVISRSGASTLAEIAAAKLPSVLVPYPYAFADHQTLNAQVFAGNRAAFVVADSDVNAEKISRLVIGMRSKPALRYGMSDRASGVFGQDAAGRVAAEVISLAGSAI